ncbi:gamma-glutamyl-gamma-aminobutyrate hydrolase family protein [Streptomyces sp. DT171]|uniref:gamma-glutamyl-gamma-aminobutyrate hydrolase family protein n=1 Tax=Streptomyces sp. DT171 TaxID=3416524 RepID=UPI003CF2A615
MRFTYPRPGGPTTPVGLTQRLLPPDSHGERRLALDVRWNVFLAACGLLAVPLPLEPELADATLERSGCAGVILTGGNDPAALGGDAVERDVLEEHLIRRAAARSTPLLGVCRGMLMILRVHGAELSRVEGHVATRHRLTGDHAGRVVNSYHSWACREAPPAFEVTARSGPLVEAVRLPGTRIAAMMWHPERADTPDPADITLLDDMFREDS